MYNDNKIRYMSLLDVLVDIRMLVLKLINV